MSTPHKVRPRLETLETRDVPTTATLDGFGNLIVNSNTNVYLQVEDSFNDVQVFADNNSPPLTSLGTFPVTGNVFITQVASNANPGPQITFDLNGFDFTGSIAITAGNAKFGDTVNIGGPTNVGPGNIFGNVSVTTGNNTNGGDFVGVGQNAPVAIQGALSVNTGSVTPPFSDIVNIGPTAGTTVTGATTILNSTFTSISGVELGGSVKIDSHLQVLQSSIVLLSSATFDHNLTVITGPLSDFVSLSADTVVTGSAAFNLGNASAGPIGDDLEFAGTVLGNLSVQAGNGADVIDLLGSAPTAIGGNLTVAVGAGQDSITLSGLSVLGNTVKVTAGNGRNAVGIDNLVAPGAALTVLLGAGNDTVTVDVGSTFVASALLDGGFGTNRLILTGGAWHFPVTIRHFN
jgi:hypothetical protein